MEKFNAVVDNIKEKLDWAIRSLERIKKAYHDKTEIQDNFWCYLCAFQYAWNYYNYLFEIQYPNLSKNQRSRRSTEIIEKWKANHLSPEEFESWNLINNMRNHDVHTAPLMPEIIEVEHLLVTENDDFLVDENGNYLSAGTFKTYFVKFKGINYDIIQLANNGISAIKKLIVFIPTLIKENHD